MADEFLTPRNVTRSRHWFRQVTAPCNVAWNHDSEFTKWQHPAMWYVALGWHAIEFVRHIGVFGAYFPDMTSAIVLTPKRTVLGQEHVNWAIQRNTLCIGSTWAQDREKKYRITKKSQKCYISPIWGEAPTEPIRPKSCVVGDVHDLITHAKFQIEIFTSYDFTGGRIFDFPIDFSMDLTTVQR